MRHLQQLVVGESPEFPLPTPLKASLRLNPGTHTTLLSKHATIMPQVWENLVKFQCSIPLTTPTEPPLDSSLEAKEAHFL